MARSLGRPMAQMRGSRGTLSPPHGEGRVTDSAPTSARCRAQGGIRGALCPPPNSAGAKHQLRRLKRGFAAPPPQRRPQQCCVDAGVGTQQMQETRIGCPCDDGLRLADRHHHHHHHDHHHQHHHRHRHHHDVCLLVGLCFCQPPGWERPWRDHFEIIVSSQVK